MTSTVGFSIADRESSQARPTIRVALAGCGVVGSALVRTFAMEATRHDIDDLLASLAAAGADPIAIRFDACTVRHAGQA